MTKDSPPRSVRWIHEVNVDGATTFRRGKLGNKLVADWPGFARLTCARDGSAPVLVPAEGVSQHDLEGLQSASIKALLRDLAGHLALHASAVAIEGHAVAFLGESGAGKSTAAAEMCSRHGAELMADDATLLEMVATGVDVLPSEERHSLTGESCHALGLRKPRRARGDDKGRVRPPRIALSPRRLAAVFALRFAPANTKAALRPLRGSEAARLLLSSAIRFDVEDGEARRRDFEQLTTVYDRVPFFELVRPGEAPGDVAPFVLDALGRALS